MAKKYFLISLGWLSVALGTLGIFLPLLPTVPFILLAAWCFARSSQRFHQWLINHKHLGPIVETWESGQGLPRGVRNRAICLIWISLLLSMWIVGELWSVILLGAIGTGSSIYLLRQKLSD